MIRAPYFIGWVLALAVAIAAFCLWADRRVTRFESAGTPAQRLLVERLQLTDLAIWTEARYSRHPSQADLFTPFQEFPGALEHFPAGSLLAPPPPNVSTRITIRSRSGDRP